MHFNKYRHDVFHERLVTHFNMNRQGHNSLVTRSEMYEIRWLNQFAGWDARRIERVYKLDYRYVMRAVLGYETMAGVIPVRGVKPLRLEKVKQ